MNIATLQRKLDQAISKDLTRGGYFTREEARQYYVIDIHDDTVPDAVEVEVRVELSYDSMVELAELLDPIVQQVDPDAYFDMVEPGIMSAWISSDKVTGCSKIKASYGGAYDIDPDVFWTKDDLVELAQEVVDQVNSRLKPFEPDLYDGADFDYHYAYIEDDNKTITIGIYNRVTDSEYSTSFVPDMRSIRSPKDLTRKYAGRCSTDLVDQILNANVL